MIQNSGLISNETQKPRRICGGVLLCEISAQLFICFRRDRFMVPSCMEARSSRLLPVP